MVTANGDQRGAVAAIESIGVRMHTDFVVFSKNAAARARNRNAHGDTPLAIVVREIPTRRYFSGTWGEQAAGQTLEVDKA